ncbi:class I adenylate-forming enzyme family protein [Streptomyces sp. SID3212]|uniref:class I adenylate-forming enzyme family protein n=1 Tax=unclassified Streptomyces TaxID=2593676 RepID=UPI00136C21A6|nr:class I adenylate-forming enzyme family protein [Streptomyces sp. SID3212]MYV57717.1 AMP-binding protein [Streptomyces sp. SID3212]
MGSTTTGLPRAGSADGTSGGTLTDLLRERADADPDGIAIVVDGRDPLTFGEWNRRADAAAHGLLRFKEPRLRRIALYFGGLDWIDYAVAYHAAQRVGAITLHLNDTMPADEIAHRLAECGVNGIVHGTGLTPPAGSSGWTASLDTLDTGRHDPPAPPPRIDGIADILYTSGTTGQAKAITVTHANMLFGRAKPTIDTLGNADHLLAAMPLGTSSSQGTASLPLLSRSILLVAPPNDPERIAELITGYACGSIMITPATALALVRARVHERHDLSSVHTVTTASSAFPPAVARDLLAALPGACLAMAYTSLEASPAVTLHLFDPAKPLSMGRPAHGTELQITDEEHRPLPAGAVGEIWMRTAAPKRRYLDTDLDQRFNVGDWTRMTDLGRLDEEGELTFFDRAADAVRSGGALISSIAVEAQLYEHPDVEEVAVIGVPDAELGQAVAAVVVLTSQDRLPDVRAFVEARLDKAEIPARYILTRALPRSFLGKVLKRELRARYGSPDAALPA